MSTLIARHNNGDLADVEFDFVRVTSLLPNRKNKPASDPAVCIAVRDTRDTHLVKTWSSFSQPLPPDSSPHRSLRSKLQSRQPPHMVTRRSTISTARNFPTGNSGGGWRIIFYRYFLVQTAGRQSPWKVNVKNPTLFRSIASVTI
jgi:hypothetical protein